MKHVGGYAAAFISGVAVMFLVWQSCGGGVWRGGVEIMTVEALTPRKLELIVDSCNGNPRAYTVQEDAESVRIRVEASSTPFKGGNDCLDAVEYYLTEPLDDRLIVDDHTGRAISNGLATVPTRSPTRTVVPVPTTLMGPTPAPSPIGTAGPRR